MKVSSKLSRNQLHKLLWLILPLGEEVSLDNDQICRILRPINSKLIWVLMVLQQLKTEDYSRKLGDYVDIHVLNAIQRTTAKAWVSDKPYDEDACLPNFGIFIIDPRKLENYVIDATMVDQGSYS